MTTQEPETTTPSGKGAYGSSGDGKSPPNGGGARTSGNAGKSGRGGLAKFLFVHEIDEYPSTGKRSGYLLLAVLATVILYYTYYAQTGVTPNILQYYHMTFSFYVGIVIVSNLIGAFASLPASKTDQVGRSNVVIYGLLIVGLIVAVWVPNATTEWSFAIAISVLGLVEGAILVATPALVRDFSPQLGTMGRASAMGFWTIGPVAGSLVTSIVASATLSHFVDWQSQFIIAGVSSLAVFVICLVLLKDLSPRLRDQLMVSTQDKILVEAKSRGLSEEEVLQATSKPWSQILKWDLVGSAAGIAVFLLMYYAASGFFTIFFSTTFKNANGSNFSVIQANDLNKWFWGADALALIVFGILSDKLRVRKPFMLIGAFGAIGMLILFLTQAGNPNTSFSTLVLLGVILASFLSMVFAPWMAAYTETVEAKNPALVATGLALWGWLLRLTVGISFIFLPVVINSVNPVVDNQPIATNTIPGTHTNVQEFLLQHPKSVAFAQAHTVLLNTLNEPKNVPVVAALTVSPSAANITRAVAVLGPTTFAQLVKYQTQLKTLVVPYKAELNYLSAHQAELTALQNGLAKSPTQWQHWFWVCVGGMILFIPTIWLTKGRWSPKKAKQDEDDHDKRVAKELKELVGANA
jgi:MFS family permease